MDAREDKAGAPEPTLEERRWALIRDALVLQLKLILEGLRDIALGPIALIAGAIGLISAGRQPERHFYRVLHAADRFDRWLDLLGALRSAPEDPWPERLPGQDRRLDDWLGRVESKLRDEYDRGGVTRQAKEALDELLDRAQPTPGRRPEPRRLLEARPESEPRADARPEARPEARPDGRPEAETVRPRERRRRRRRPGADKPRD